MKRVNILGTAIMLMVFTFFAVNLFAAGEGMERQTSPAAQMPTEREGGQMSAEAAADGPFRASQVLGKSLRGDNDETLGEVADLIIGPEGEITFALVGRGGVLGLGESYTAVPWSAVSRDVQKGDLLASISKERFDQAPTFSGDEIEKIARADFEAKVYGYYGEARHPEKEHKGMEHEGSMPMGEKSPAGANEGQ